MPTDPLLTRLVDTQFASRLSNADTSAFSVSSDPDALASIATRLGWLAAPTGMQSHLAEVRELAESTRTEGFTDLYLLGMGGSSLCAEVLRDVPLSRAGRSRLVVLDTTDERAVRAATDGLAPERALFIVASKSGSTIEVSSLERHFFGVLAKAGRPRPGQQFVAITDPGTTLVAHAAQEGYRHAFVNPADIGGRYSALSLFGLVPAALLGLDVDALLEAARQMAEACRADHASNPGLALGAFMASQSLAGQDKLTVLAAGTLEPLGVWIEQLVAESTGKLGRGVLPVVGEPIGDTEDYGSDRAFIAIITPDGAEVGAAADRLEGAGHPVFRIDTTVEALGAEFFRWEFATAVAGAGLDVNPFDEPNVRDAKARTQAQLVARRATGSFTLDPPLSEGPSGSRREHQGTGTAAPGTAGSYIAILDYLPADGRRADAVMRLRAAIRRRTHAATTYGIGPRYLHSTGQYHKGGPNTGGFLLFTAADATATPVPETDFTFSALKYAQALGDFAALAAAGRHVIHYHVGDPSADFTRELETLLAEFVS
jgi:glucose-6-phosphate isomerase